MVALLAVKTQEKREQLEERGMQGRARLHYTYALPASVLSDEPVDRHDTSSLRDDASQNGTCFVQLIRALGDGSYLAKVAACPELVSTKGYTLLLNDDIAGRYHSEIGSLPLSAI